MFEIQLASKYPDNANNKISKIFVDGFYEWLHYFSKDKTKLANAFSHMFNPGVFYIACLNGEIGGIAACNNGKIKSVHLEKKELKKHLSFVKGTIAYTVLKHEFEEETISLSNRAGYGVH